MLDANVPIAMTVSGHVDHAASHAWFAHRRRRFATCPITQGASLRFHLRSGATAAAAWSVLAALTRADAHELWPDELDYSAVSSAGIIGHAQVTDAYLAALARNRGGKLPTFDHGLGQQPADVVEMLGARRK